MIGKTEWPHLLADLKAKRDALDQVIATIETHFVPVNGAMPESPLPGRAPKTRRIVKQNGAVARVTPANGKADATGDAVISELRRLGGAASPGKLASALRWDRARLRYQLQPLLRQKLVVATGATANRVISLPGKLPGKEGL